MKSQSPRTSCISAIARAYAKEKRDASLVRRHVPDRIDSLFLTELQLVFEHDLVDLVGCAAYRCSRRTLDEARTIAKGTMLAAINRALTAVQGLETRMSARTKMALGNGTTVELTADLRDGVLADFSDELAEIVRVALSLIARLSDPSEAMAVRAEAKTRLYWVREKWEAVLACKTQISELLNDNDCVSARRQQDLLREAAEVMQVDNPPFLRTADVAEVVRFLTDAILRCPKDDKVREKVVSSLAIFLLPHGRVGPGHAWICVASRVLSALAEHARENVAAMQLQAFWRGCSARKAFLWRRRAANAHAIFQQTVQPALDPVLLAQSLLRQAITLAGSSTRSEASLAVIQLQRRCITLRTVNIAALEKAQERKLSFWLNVRNLGVLLAVLLAAPDAHSRQGRSLMPQENCSSIDRSNTRTHSQQKNSQRNVAEKNTTILQPESPSGRRHRRANTTTSKSKTSENDEVAVSRRHHKARTQVFGPTSFFPLRSIDVGPETWSEGLHAGSLLIGDVYMMPNQIDHHILHAGESAPLPAPARRIWHAGGSAPEEIKGLGSWVVFGLWLPVRFGLPPLRVYQPEMLLVQLRLNAQAFLTDCLKVAAVAGHKQRTIALPPLLEKPGLPPWQTLLGIRGENDIATTSCSIDWTFDRRRLVALGAEDVDLLCSTSDD